LVVSRRSASATRNASRGVRSAELAASPAPGLRRVPGSGTSRLAWR
jgi:hypothetical protein